MIRAMSNPVSWDAASIGWSRQGGYRVYVPLWADERALALREDEATKAIWNALPKRPNPFISMEPMVVREDASGSRAEHGVIVIGTDTMLTDAEAAEIRDGVTQAFEGSTEEAERAAAADDEAAKAVLAVLKLDS
jgi:hypothetical protein